MLTMRPPADAATPLSGRTIVVTRPAAQSRPLAERIAAAGGRVILFPVIDIQPTTRPEAFRAVVDTLETFDLAVFISPNAVERAMTLIAARRKWPSGPAVAAIGGATAKALARHGIERAIVPERYDSESLLALDALRAIAGKRVVIFRGEGGRELLGEALAARGAAVSYAECYRRTRPDTDAAPLLEAWRNRALHAITMTSSEGLRNFIGMVGQRAGPSLAATPLFVPHPRIAATAREAGMSVIIETGAGDEGLYEGLVQYFGAR
jgi:uroporphyrinogen-III synthase